MQVCRVGHVLASVFTMLYAFSFGADSLNGATHFVRAGSSGNGTSWENAWGNLSTIAWTGLAPGDTVCVAGGSYDNLTMGKSGTAEAAITIQRATASDPVCGSSTRGWNSDFDSQVNLSRGVSWGSANYVRLEGVVRNGIRLNVANDGSNGINFPHGVTNPTISHVEVSGPGGTSPIRMNEDNRCINLVSWNGTVFETTTGLLLAHSNIHGCVNLLWMYNVMNSTIEFTTFADAAALNSTTYHANVLITAGSQNITFRHNEITNWQVEGIMWIFGGAANWYIYGNLWHDGMGGVDGNTHRILEAQDGVEGPVFFYNNTCVNIHLGVRTANDGRYAPGSQGRNNIYWNAGNPGLPSDDYDLSNSDTGEPHGVTESANPFARFATQNYHLAAHTAPGLALSAPYHLDFDGNLRGSDGTWDRGAYQFSHTPRLERQRRTTTPP